MKQSNYPTGSEDSIFAPWNEREREYYINADYTADFVVSKSVHLEVVNKSVDVDDDEFTAKFEKEHLTPCALIIALADELRHLMGTASISAKDANNIVYLLDECKGWQEVENHENVEVENYTTARI